MSICTCCFWSLVFGNALQATGVWMEDCILDPYLSKRCYFTRELKLESLTPPNRRCPDDQCRGYIKTEAVKSDENLFLLLRPNLLCCWQCERNRSHLIWHFQIGFRPLPTVVLNRIRIRFSWMRLFTIPQRWQKRKWEQGSPWWR